MQSQLEWYCISEFHKITPQMHQKELPEPVANQSQS